MKKRCDKKYTQVVEGTVIPAPPTPPRLRTIRDCRLEMSRVYADMRAGRIDCRDGARLVFCLTSIVTTIRDNELEQRIENLEEAAANEKFRSTR